jgi:hypothetical protein
MTTFHYYITIGNIRRYAVTYYNGTAKIRTS